MKKVLGRIFGALISIIGHLGLWLSVFGIIAVIFTKANDVYFFIALILMPVSIVSLIIAKIGDSIEDRVAGNARLAMKRVFAQIIRVLLFTDFGTSVFALVGLALLAVGLFVLFYTGDVFFLVLFAYFIVTFGICLENCYGYKGYAARHCKYCHKNLKGASYSFQEYEREYVKNVTKSKIEFHFYCAHCGEENLRYEKMNTDKRAVTKYARIIVGKR